MLIVPGKLDKVAAAPAATATAQVGSGPRLNVLLHATQALSSGGLQLLQSQAAAPASGGGGVAPATTVQELRAQVAQVIQQAQVALAVKAE